MEEGGSKLTGIRQIVRLKGFLQKWQSVTIGNNNSKSTTNRQQKTNNNNNNNNNKKGYRRRRSSSGISPDISKRLRISNDECCDSEEENSCNSPTEVPKGYLAVYVGAELRRFIIPTTYLSHSLFKVLLEKVEEEFGFNHNGGLTIPCEIETFKFLLNCMEHHPKNDHHSSHASAVKAILSH